MSNVIQGTVGVTEEGPNQLCGHAGGVRKNFPGEMAFKQSLKNEWLLTR